MATKTATNASETINGTSVRDRIFARGGNCIVNGLGGADKLTARPAMTHYWAGSRIRRLDRRAGIDTASYFDDHRRHHRQPEQRNQLGQPRQRHAVLDRAIPPGW